MLLIKESPADVAFQQATDALTGDQIFQIRISNQKVVWLEFDSFDIHLKRECDKSNAVADKLLWLENLVRKIEKAKGVPQP